MVYVNGKMKAAELLNIKLLSSNKTFKQKLALIKTERINTNNRRMQQNILRRLFYIVSKHSAKISDSMHQLKQFIIRRNFCFSSRIKPFYGFFETMFF